jgi:hypothetical protein
VRMNVTKPSPLASLADDVGDTLPGELLAPLRREQPWQAAVADGEIALDGAPLIAGTTDAIITPRGRHRLATKQTGATPGKKPFGFID